MTKIINGSLQSGHFSEVWKEALVYPLVKKLGVQFTFSKQFTIHFVQPTKLSSITFIHTLITCIFALQSSFRKNHSTATALVKINNDILLNMNKHVARLVLDHDITLKRLSSKFGHGPCLQWFQLYSKGREQRTSVHGSVSEKFDLSCGVPQGSCLGSLLYTINAKVLFSAVKAPIFLVYTVTGRQHAVIPLV